MGAVAILIVVVVTAVAVKFGVVNGANSAVNSH